MLVFLARCGLAVVLLGASACGDGPTPPPDPLASASDARGDCERREVVDDGSALRVEEAGCRGGDVRSVAVYREPASDDGEDGGGQEAEDGGEDGEDERPRAGEDAFVLEVVFGGPPAAWALRGATGAVTVEPPDEGAPWSLHFTCEAGDLTLEVLRRHGPAEEVPVGGLGCRELDDRLRIVLSPSVFALDGGEEGEPRGWEVTALSRWRWFGGGTILDRLDTPLSI